ncbi:MAG TPA: alanine racemase [Terriglobales bacterium]|nr:alanine racemase [Terriglobales bacterium]
MTPTRADIANYRISDATDFLTPALAVYADLVDHNISRMLTIVGDANRWRPHVKTAKLAYTIRRLVDHGIVHMKCATTLELITACEAGARDVVFAYPIVGGAAERVKEVAACFPSAKVSALIEQAGQVELWRGSRMGIFLDVNSGMNRTGIDPFRIDEILNIVRNVIAAGLHFRGVHYYDGHHTHPNLDERTFAAHDGYTQLLQIVRVLGEAGICVEEVITSGTPTFPCALSFAGFRNSTFVHRISPGTVVYNDCTSLSQLPDEYHLRAAALVISSVVSHPANNLFTCDAGHKTVSLDTGVPNCVAIGRNELQPLKPSEEHLPLRVAPGSPVPTLGERLYLVPRHVCPTVNNFDHALIVRDGRIIGVEQVTSRGREAPLHALSAHNS